MKRNTSALATILKTALVVGALAGGLLLAGLISDIHKDRSFRLVIRGSVNVYANPAPPEINHSNPIIAVLGTEDEVEVRRIRRDEAHGWIRVRLPDGREGYIFMDSDIELRRR